MPERREARTSRFPVALWAALEVEAARQNSSVNRLLENIAIAATKQTGETK